MYAIIKKSVFRKYISVITVLFFIVNAVTGNVLNAQSMPVLAGGIMPEVEAELFRVDTCSVPLSLGEIKDRIEGNNGKTIIHLQDAHCNYSAQHSIADMVEYFKDAYNVDLAFLEGGTGNYNFAGFESIDDPAVKEQVSDYFVKEGIVSGPEFFAINNAGDVELCGIEDPDLYQKNLEVYRDSCSYKKEADGYIAFLDNGITNLKRKAYTPGMQEIDGKTQAYKNGEVEFKDYVLFLTEKSGNDTEIFQGVENILIFNTLLKDGQDIDFKKADKERKKLIDMFQTRLSQKNRERVALKSLQFKNGDISSKDFYRYLFQKAKGASIDLGQFPDLMKYSAYMKRYETIDKAEFYKETVLLEEALMFSLAETEDQRTIYEMDRDMGIIKDLFNISLVKDKYDYYKKNKKRFNTARFLKFLKKKGLAYGLRFDIDKNVRKLDSYRDRMQAFYEYSFDRDKAFIKNIESKLTEKGSETALLVTGGFHTDNLSSRLKDKGYSYVVIMPKLKSEKDCPYFNLLAGKDTPLDEVIKKTLAFKPERSNIAVQSLFSEMGIDQSNKNMIKLKTDILSSILKEEDFTVQTRFGYVSFSRVLLEENADLVDNFSVPLAEGEDLKAGVYVTDTIRGGIDIVLVDGGTMTVEQHDIWMDKIGKKVGTRDLNEKEESTIKEGLKNLGLTDDDINNYVLRENILIWEKAIGLTEGHAGRHDIFLSPDVFKKGNKYVAIILMQEMGAAYGVSHEVNRELNEAYKRRDDRWIRIKIGNIMEEVKKGTRLSADVELQVRDLSMVKEEGEQLLYGIVPQSLTKASRGIGSERAPGLSMAEKSTEPVIFSREDDDINKIQNMLIEEISDLEGQASQEGEGDLYKAFREQAITVPLWVQRNQLKNQKGFDESIMIGETRSDVKWHDYTHAGNNTAETMKAMKNANASAKATLLTAIAGMYHDMGYFIEDYYGFGTIKVDHEQRSKEFVLKNAERLGITDQFDKVLITLVISGTEAGIGPKFDKGELVADDWRELLDLIDKGDHEGIKKKIIAIIQLDKRDGRLAREFTVTDAELGLLREVIQGAKILAALDVYDTRDDAVERVADLWHEFKRDKEKLSLKELAENKMVQEENEKIMLAGTDIEQIAGTEGFYKFYASPRVNELGVWGYMSDRAENNFNKTRSKIAEINAKVNEKEKNENGALKNMSDANEIKKNSGLDKMGRREEISIGARPMTPEEIKAEGVRINEGVGKVFENVSNDLFNGQKTLNVVLGAVPTDSEGNIMESAKKDLKLSAIRSASRKLFREKGKISSLYGVGTEDAKKYIRVMSKSGLPQERVHASISETVLAQLEEDEEFIKEMQKLGAENIRNFLAENTLLNIINDVDKNDIVYATPYGKFHRYGLARLNVADVMIRDSDNETKSDAIEFLAYSMAAISNNYDNLNEMNAFLLKQAEEDGNFFRKVFALALPEVVAIDFEMIRAIFAAEVEVLRSL